MDEYVLSAAPFGGRVRANLNSGIGMAELLPMGAGIWSRPLVWLIVAVGVIFSVLMVFPVLPEAAGDLVSYAVRTVTVFAAAIAMGLRAKAATGRLRFARAMVSASLLFGALGGVASVVIRLMTEATVPVPSISDAIYFLFFPTAIIGLLSYPVSKDEAGSGLRALLDGAVAAAGLWFIIYVLIIEPAAVANGAPMIEKATILAYPATDVFVIAMGASVLIRVSNEARRELTIVWLGMGLIALQDLAFTVASASNSYSPVSWIAACAELGLLLILFGSATSPPDTSTATSTGWSKKLGWLPLVPAFAAVLVAAGLALGGYVLNPVETFIGVSLVTLLLLHQIIGNRDRTALTSRLRKREQLFRSLVIGSSDLITLHDSSGAVLYASPAMARAVGLSEEALLEAGPAELIHPDDRAEVAATLHRVIQTPNGTASVTSRLRWLTSDSDPNRSDTRVGEWRWTETVMHNMLHDPDVGGVVCNTRDVNEQHILREQLQHDAYHDALTGLGNLVAARATIAERCYSGAGSPSTMVLADLDGFKTINDTFGHAFGDALLVAIGRRLEGTVGTKDLVSRIGGDEFVVVLEDPADTAAAADRILNVLRHPVMVEGNLLSVEASIGLANSADAETPDELLRNADLAMYAAKAGGRNRMVWYQPWMHEKTSQRMRMQEGLRRALDDDNFSLNYQPIVHLPDGELAGAEALLRWDDPLSGRIPPDVFIEVAEGSGVITDIDMWVLDQACRQIATWGARGLVAPRLSINVSRRQITPMLPDLVERTLTRNGLTGRHLCIEVTESAVLPDAELAWVVLQQLRDLGVTVALDDFGTGQSSLSQLARLPVDSVKIDKSFVMSSSKNHEALRLLTSIVGVCRALNVPTIAEGIEDAEAVSNLAAMGCEYGQGFYFARPQTAHDFEALLVGPQVPSARTARGRAFAPPAA